MGLPELFDQRDYITTYDIEGCVLKDGLKMNTHGSFQRNASNTLADSMLELTIHPCNPLAGPFMSIKEQEFLRRFEELRDTLDDIVDEGEWTLLQSSAVHPTIHLSRNLFTTKKNTVNNPSSTFPQLQSLKDSWAFPPDLDASLAITLKTYNLNPLPVFTSNLKTYPPVFLQSRLSEANVCINFDVYRLPVKRHVRYPSISHGDFSTVDSADSRIFSADALGDNLFTYFSPSTLVAWSLLNRQEKANVDQHWNRCCTASTFLQDFFNPIQVLMLRVLMRRSGALISGSMALVFFTRMFFSQIPDLDIYVYFDFSDTMTSFVSSCGYRLQRKKTPTSDDDEDTESYRPDLPFVNVDTFVHKDSDRTIQIIHCRRSPLETILHFHSSCVMNFLSADAAYSLFPMPTLEYKIAFTSDQRHPSTDVALDKYRQRGWRFVSSLQPSADISIEESSSFRIGVRRVGDRWTLKKPLLPALPSASDDLIECNTWKVLWAIPSYRPFICYGMLFCDSLKHKYTVASQDWLDVLIGIYRRGRDVDVPGDGSLRGWIDLMWNNHPDRGGLTVDERVPQVDESEMLMFMSADM
ncbi:hypothetical protein CVT24_000310 [Panaeolus cyanescens]|uniref:Uncharacterized protein n=1 Tax=Panaeolus cyanescens TaxID=181874 RepID=A0A409YCU9_9AGAR|nr:hypothetical protein CVT24_000310 [Panaeolus cyanescens]